MLPRPVRRWDGAPLYSYKYWPVASSFLFRRFMSVVGGRASAKWHLPEIAEPKIARLKRSIANGSAAR
ncbi:hypothetical protein RRF57_006603 [Xylaria bambusicola]|uniref:Uncharacterized protein n=1 Tax=Xylaria bambusicola TaxID=326684 RepID=A0AAN7UQL3_9PEZI